MAIKRAFFAVYASPIRKRPERGADFTKSPAHTGGPAMRGGLRRCFAQVRKPLQFQSRQKPDTMPMADMRDFAFVHCFCINDRFRTAAVIAFERKN
ncbi:hypothetical protein [Roseovarius pacificus]|uniref:hypothetical protein n=1 Tax=Roseovarius pacificus TaxID=337701 RepID=UPI002A1881AF|nr:hypothetical protein [Roseovarius pacificus]